MMNTKGIKNGLLLSIPLWLCICALGLATLACGVQAPTNPAANEIMRKPIIDLSGFITPTLEHNPKSGKMVVCLSADAVNLRTGAGTSYEVVRVMTSGDPVTLLGTPTISEDMGVWYEVEDKDGVAGYVNARYLCQP